MLEPAAKLVEDGLGARGVELPLVEKTLACYEETQRKVSGAAEVSAVSVYWASRATT